ncbi:hypothetical protein SXIM_25790 [Streptomyces xiamenensis]|uniref:Uncharacterized protein n=1 Tax=Streptomyces xiamenensis TaxID=408015 RepID=A0A0F7FVQ6_9ACTN|nr:hypothetical protein SXIM_25790 [Streptomyces xiamenensis]
MAQRGQDHQTVAPLPTAIVYSTALAAGVVLIGSGQTSAPEALGYVAPLLVLYERLLHRR